MKNRKIIISSLLLAGYGLTGHTMAFAGWGQNSGGHMMGPGYMGWFMMLFWVLLLIALIILIRWIAQLPRKKMTRTAEEKTPLDILKERLARGEIEIDEYNEKKRLLSN